MNRKQSSPAVKVFLVEDYVPIRERLAELIHTVEGARVVGVADEAEDALERIKASEPDIVIVDLQLRAGTSGMSVLKWLREHAPHVVAVVLSNIAYPQMRQACLDLGARLVLDKASEALHVRDAVAQIALARAGD
ncbi:response regulator transcription factor [Trinickia caryophylli]|uniref:Response regulator receiver domain-containing protein n=1 Tax=Trinickia caryophylli TaxID=28094 RepID=A0A1X7GFQ1_TRICW|nr:response regulator transcription factor [Trinickia caryophylli]PMS10730.1 DNA-binding response regulator [Trinickia caryophylli]TRX13895.1 response regulator transcription factor [Trinickia caryophylli]WQE15485.1 response regulator transcription factor [Trinickia caryophylli]SMF69118.1 Response regulator receiver domain-containing protein [Trinickia caryophylli]GLU33770.1 hypothetical protein Busp01_36120 [Trinickia caryophylli]